MKKYIINYSNFLFEEEKKKEGVASKIASKELEKGAKSMKDDPSITKDKDGKPVTIPKDIQIKKLAKGLMKAQYDVATFKYVLADKVAKMKKDGADEDTIAKADEMAADQMANVQLRVDAIAAQMIALAGDNAKLAAKAEELSQAAISSALKAAQEFYVKRSEKWVKDTEDKKDKKGKESEDKEKDEEKEEEKEK